MNAPANYDHRNPYHAEIASLRAQLDEAQEELRQLRDSASSHEIMLLPSKWHLTRTMRRILLAIMRGRPISRDDLYTAIYDHSSTTTAKVIDVHISGMRKRLKPFGIEIETVWGLGYRISPASRAIVQAAIEAERSELIPHPFPAKAGSAALVTTSPPGVYPRPRPRII